MSQFAAQFSVTTGGNGFADVGGQPFAKSSIESFSLALRALARLGDESILRAKGDVF
jgi:hypothetical protein